MANIIGVGIDHSDRRLTKVSSAPPGSYLVISIEGKDYAISKADLSSQTSEAASIDFWDGDTIYNTDTKKYAEHNNRLWRSKQNDNQGHEPPSAPEVIQDDWWVEVSPSEPSSLKEWRQGIYTADEVVVKYEGNLVELVNSTRPFESVDILVEIAAGDWRYLPENKADKKPGVAEDNIWVSDGSGGLKDSGVPISSLGSGGGSSLETYPDIPAMLADQANQVDKQLFEVTDASKDYPAAGQGDPTIDQAGTKGWYRYKGVANGLRSDYVKVSEEEAFSENSGAPGGDTITQTFTEITASVITINPTRKIGNNYLFSVDGNRTFTVDFTGVPEAASGIIEIIKDNNSTPRYIALPDNAFVNENDYTEENDINATPKNISGVANNGSGRIRITAAGHGYTTDDRVNIENVEGTVEANGKWTVTVIDADNFDLQTSDFLNSYTSGGTATRLDNYLNIDQNANGVTILSFYCRNGKFYMNLRKGYDGF